LRKANTWCNFMMANFYDRKDGYFHFSSKTAEKLIAKKKEIFDNVIPSSNSVMARNLYHLGIISDHGEWKEIATTMIAKLASMAESEPSYMSHWGILFAEITKGIAEVVIVGKDAEKLRKELHTRYFPFTMTLGAVEKSALPLFEGREAKDGQTKIYVCFNKTCKLPVTRIEDAILQLSS
ncbi:MAG TPA: thioredoxin domain-containing protein, partial [Cyclobacteriaceae bacterium]|nr:thioredoxin domain-containing protein [Cyclobacteriaceae bacterium]